MKPSSLRSALKTLITAQRPAFIWGPPGVGKSDLVREVAKDSKLELRDVRLSLLDPIDLKGFPTINTVKKQMQWLPAEFLPTKGKGILFLDEMNSAPQSVQAAAYQLVLDRKIGEYKLPDGWYVMGAGNRAGDRSVVHEMPAALRSRFVHLDFDVNVDDWSNWAADHDVHIDIRAFIKFRPALLHSFDTVANPRAFPCPRTWKFVDDLYKSGLGQNEEFELIKGTVGEGTSAEFSAFTRLIKDLPSVDQILLDPEGTKVPDNPAARFALATALDAKTTVANIARVMKYVERMPIEFQVVYMRSALRRDIKLNSTKTFMAWALKHQEVLL